MPINETDAQMLLRHLVDITSASPFCITQRDDFICFFCAELQGEADMPKHAADCAWLKARRFVNTLLVSL